MAYDVNKLTKLGALRQMAQRIAADYATKEEVTAAVNAKVSSAYKAGGSAAFDALPELTEANVGLVVNVTDSFTTTDSFAEGAGKQYPAGTNVLIIEVGGEYKYDALSGFVDLSGYVEQEEGKGLSANDFTDEDKAKLAAVAEGATKVEASESAGHIKINDADVSIVDIATDEEVQEMFDEVFGTKTVNRNFFEVYGISGESVNVKFEGEAQILTLKNLTNEMTMDDIASKLKSKTGYLVSYDESGVFSAYDEENTKAYDFTVTVDDVEYTPNMG